MAAQIQFIDCRLTLIHIPLHVYEHFVQPILKLTVPTTIVNGSDVIDESSYGPEARLAGLGPSNGDQFHSREQSEFVNISITPVECSVVCSKDSADSLFTPIIQTLDPKLREQVKLSQEEFMVIQVDGEGSLDAGQRVLDLTSPLALAGVSIFFITTYFSDYILVPVRSRAGVARALEQRGFVFEKHADAFVGQSHHRNASSTSSSDVPPQTPPPTNLDELQSRTFATLKRQNIKPTVNHDTKLVLCAEQRHLSRPSDNRSKDGALHLGLVKCFISKPQFLSVTLTHSEPASLLVEKELIPYFGDNNILLGSKEDILIPIVLDLRELPLESTGIVCGVAARLVGSESRYMKDGRPPIEMSYLSTARAGTVMVAQEELSRAVEALDI